MKKIAQTIKLRKFKTNLSPESIELLEGNEFLIWYKDGTTKDIFLKDDLIEALENDHIKPIRYIFDMSDRIILDRDIKIDITKI